MPRALLGTLEITEKPWVPAPPGALRVMGDAGGTMKRPPATPGSKCQVSGDWLEPMDQETS